MTGRPIGFPYCQNAIVCTAETRSVPLWIGCVAGCSERSFPGLGLAVAILRSTDGVLTAFTERPYGLAAGLTLAAPHARDLHARLGVRLMHL